MEILHSESGEALAQLPREAVGAPSLEALKARLDGALGNLSWWESALPMAGLGARCSLKSLSTRAIL